ncbi:MAG: response regulator [Prolixibacteraceae bacterium]|nr:response regulator [Prolixibacteraceae bacterium]
MNRIYKLFSGLNIKWKLIILNGIFLGSIFILGFAVNKMLKSSQTMTILISENRVFIENFGLGKENFLEYEISNDEVKLTRSLEYFNKANEIAYTFSVIDSLMIYMPEEERTPYLLDVFGDGLGFDLAKMEIMLTQMELFQKISPEKLEELKSVANNASTLVKGIIANIQQYSQNPTEEKRIAIEAHFDRMPMYTLGFSQAFEKFDNYVSNLMQYMVLLLVIVIGGFVTFLSHAIIKSITKPISILFEDFKRMAKGDLKSTIIIDSDNEIGALSKSFYELRVGLQNIVNHAKSIAQGDYKTRLEPYSEKDELSISLNKMVQKLEETKNRFDRENWLQKGLNGLDDQMRGNHPIGDLSERIVIYLCQFLEAEIGAIYVYDEILNHLELTSSVGINLTEVEKVIKPGEGLIGKAAKSTVIQIIDTKDKFSKVYSATGEIYPEKLYLLPLFFDGKILAVIEIASVNSLSESKHDFLNLIKDRISVNINAAIARYRNKELLDKSLEQAEILKARDEELSQKLEENQRIRENLSYQTALLNSMLNTLPDNVYFKDKESRFLRVSESMAKSFNVKSSNDVIGKTDFDFHQRKYATQYYSEEQEIIKTGKGFIDDVRQSFDENGEEQWKSVTKLPMFDEQGNCIGTFGITKNVTDIKKLEKEVKLQNDNLVENQEKLIQTINEMDKIHSQLTQEKALMDSLLNNLPDAVYFKDRESKFIKVSKSMSRLFNLEKQEDLYGKSDFDFFGNEHATRAYDDEQRIMKTKVPVIGKIETETFHDGSKRYVSSTKMPLLNDKREVIGTFGISRDVTKIKELEFEVKERNEKLNEQKAELELINERLKQQQEELQATNEELHAQEEELRVANEELAEQTKILVESEKNLQVQQEELQVTNEELESKSNLLELQKNDILVKNKKLDKARIELENKAKELELASQYKSEFLANMSHELRTPLNSMLILSKLLGNNKNNNLTDDQLKSISIIYNSGKDLLELINEILDLSKIEAGKMNFDFSDVLSDEIIEEININFTPVAENKNLSLDINKADNFPELIYTDRQRLMQVIKNLLSNAFKFTSKGGIKVEFGIPEKEVNFANSKLNNKNTCFIAVEDTGVGIPQDKVDAIFEAFQQADGSISRKFGGTGLGLSISKQIIQVFGGEMIVTSTEGVGSVFTVYLPLDKKLVGQDLPKHASEDEETEDAEGETADVKQEKIAKQVEVDEKSSIADLPYFVDDDRDSSLNKEVILIIHGEKGKAKSLIKSCHTKKFSAIAASNIPDALVLAEKFTPQAIIISAELNDFKEMSKLKDNKLTARVPLHVVSRIEDFMFEDIHELQTPESEGLLAGAKNIENKMGKEFRQVLVVEDDIVTRFSIQKLFENKNIIIHEAKTAGEAFEMISSQLFDCIILDLGLPDFSGVELLDKLKANKIPIPYVIINTAKELSAKELRKLQQYSESIVIKGVKSDERLTDEVTLFLHQVSNTLPKKNQLAAIENTGFKGKKVLVVDDDIRNVFAMAQILEERDIEIMEAENGEVAIEVLKNNADIDLVLMDVMMPVMNGYEAMKIIRKTEGIDTIPIIVLTAKAMKEDYQKAIDFGANDFISKPVDVDKLISLLKIWLFK